MNDTQNKAYLCPIIIGLILFLVGLFIQMPGGVLVTYKSLDGVKAEDYIFDDRYSSIDEYVGGDAYNYIIGATLVAGKMAGTMITKAICMVAGVMCCGFGATMGIYMKNKALDKQPSNIHIDTTTVEEQV